MLDEKYLIPMEMFSFGHIIAIIVCAAIFIAVILNRKLFERSVVADKIFRYTVGGTLLALEIGFTLFHYFHDGVQDFKSYLINDLCAYLVWILIVAMLFDFKKIIKIIYPACLLGGILSLVTISVEASFPHFRAFQFVATHFIMILGSSYFFMSGKIKTYRFCDLMCSMLALAVFSLPFYIGGLVDGNNYFYLMGPPEGLEAVSDILKGWYTICFVSLVILLFNLFWAITWKSTKHRLKQI